jgi:hypothetical protein
LQRALDALLATLPRSQIGQFEYGGQSWSQIAGSAGTPPMNWGFRKQYFVLAIGDKSLEQLLDRLAKKNRSTPAWKQSLETRLSLERVSTFMHIDAAKAVSLAAQGSGHRPPRNRRGCVWPLGDRNGFSDGV